MYGPRCLIVSLALVLGCGGEKKQESAGGESSSAQVVTPTPSIEPGDTDTKNGEPEVDERTGLIVAEGFDVVASTCVTCHSGRLVAQNRGTRRDWDERLRWMQANHNLWELPAETRTRILDYLATNYGVEDDERRHQRRRPLPDHLMPPTRAEASQTREPAAR